MEEAWAGSRVEGAREICKIQQMGEGRRWKQGRGTENSGYCKKRKKIFGTKRTKVIGDSHLPVSSGSTFVLEELMFWSSVFPIPQLLSLEVSRIA